ncbi:MAG: transglutaminase domain-containing protein [DPANN group archaeon]|nr:transglutaminase domain-containing protein [DPANN group archaeon]
MRKLVTLLLLLLIPTALAAETFDPRTTSYIEVDYSAGSTITAVPDGSAMPYISAQLHAFPKTTDTMNVMNFRTSPQASLIGSDETEAYKFEWKDVPAGSYDYKISANIKNSNYFPKVYKKIKFPFDVPADLKKYTIPTEKTESNDPEIKKLANELASGEDDAYVISFKIANWVQKNIDYDESAWQGVASAKDVLATKRGVCDEYTNIYMALMRSLGFPVRYKVGSVYTNIPSINNFQYHAWAEVWMPDVGWVPFDTTFAEYGWLDPTHIEVMQSQTVELPSLSYQWRSGKINASELSANINILEKKDRLPEFIETEAWMQEKHVVAGSYDIFWVKLQNNADFYIHTATSLSRGLPIEDDINQFDILLTPHSSKTVGWLFKVPSDIEENYIYSYGFETETIFGDSYSMQLKVSEDGVPLSRAEAESLLMASMSAREKNGRPALSFNVRTPEKTYAGRKYNIEVVIKNSGDAPAERTEVCANSLCDIKYIGINEEASFNFTGTAVLGENKNHITVMSDNYSDERDIIINASEKPILDRIREFFSNILMQLKQI